MSCGGPLSAVMSIAGAGLLPGAGALAGLGSALGPASSLTSALGSFGNLPITGIFSDIVSSASGLLGSGTLDSLRTLGADIFPALTNAIPGDFSGLLNIVSPGGVFDGGFTGLIDTFASNIMGAGDLTQFAQIFNSAQGFVGQANALVNSALNINNISSTFGPLTGGMDNLITGSLNQVTQAFGQFGSDLGNLGSLINMDNLANLGNPASLLQQLSNVGGFTPAVDNILQTAGLDSTQLARFVSGSAPNFTDTANRLVYEGMTQVTGNDLQQVLSILNVRTPGLDTMADLLNPSKILPNSYPSLTMPTPDGLRGIYTGVNTVNTNIEKFLQDPNAAAYTGDDPIVLARLGQQPVEIRT
jgi:hypothetical protein